MKEMRIIGEERHDRESSPEAKRLILIRAVIGEFICTSIVLFGLMAAIINSSTSGVPFGYISAVTFALLCIGVIYSFSDVSGAHFNPAVTFGCIVTGKTSPFKGILYICAQLFGAIFATMMVGLAFPESITNNVQKLLVQPSPHANGFSALMNEFFSTYILLVVIFSVVYDTLDTKNVSVTEKDGGEVMTKNLTLYSASGRDKAGFGPIAIGLTLGFLTNVGSSVSGASFNPARAFGPALLSWHWSWQWLYWLGPFLGAAAGAWTQMGLHTLRSMAMNKT